MSLNDTLEQMDIINIYITFHHTAVEYTFFSSTLGAVLDHMLLYKLTSTSLRRWKSYHAYSLTAML